MRGTRSKSAPTSPTSSSHRSEPTAGWIPSGDESPARGPSIAPLLTHSRSSSSLTHSLSLPPSPNRAELGALSSRRKRREARKVSPWQTRSSAPSPSPGQGGSVTRPGVGPESDLAVGSLLAAAEEADGATLRSLLTRHPWLVSHRDSYSRTLLHSAAAAGRLDHVRILLNAQASISTPDLLGNTPLHLAATQGNIAIVQAILARAGGRPDLVWGAKDGLGKSPLDWMLERLHRIAGLVKRRAHSTGRELRVAAGDARLREELAAALVFVQSELERNFGMQATTKRDEGDSGEAASSWSERLADIETLVGRVKSGSAPLDESTVGLVIDETEELVKLMGSVQLD